MLGPIAKIDAIEDWSISLCKAVQEQQDALEEIHAAYVALASRYHPVRKTYGIGEPRRVVQKQLSPKDIAQVYADMSAILSDVRNSQDGLGDTDVGQLIQPSDATARIVELEQQVCMMGATAAQSTDRIIELEQLVCSMGATAALSADHISELENQMHRTNASLSQSSAHEEKVDGHTTPTWPKAAPPNACSDEKYEKAFSFDTRSNTGSVSAKLSTPFRSLDDVEKKLGQLDSKSFAIVEPRGGRMSHQEMQIFHQRLLAAEARADAANAHCRRTDQELAGVRAELEKQHTEKTDTVIRESSHRKVVPIPGKRVAIIAGASVTSATVQSSNGMRQPIVGHSAQAMDVNQCRRVVQESHPPPSVIQAQLQVRSPIPASRTLQARHTLFQKRFSVTTASTQQVRIVEPYQQAVSVLRGTQAGEVSVGGTRDMDSVLIAPQKEEAQETGELTPVISI